MKRVLYSMFLLGLSWTITAQTTIGLIHIGNTDKPMCSVFVCHSQDADCKMNLEVLLPIHIADDLIFDQITTYIEKEALFNKQDTLDGIAFGHFLLTAYTENVILNETVINNEEALCLLAYLHYLSPDVNDRALIERLVRRIMF